MSRAIRLVVSVAFGAAAFLALFPSAATMPVPPTFYSVVGNRVPTDNPLLAIAAGLSAAGLVWLSTRPGRPRP